MGKVPGALPLIVQDFNLSIAQSGNFVSIYGLLIAIFGLLVGATVLRFGYVAFAVCGVTLAAFGSTVGYVANSVNLLMLGRALEGLGWILGAVAIPALLGCISHGKDKPIVMGLWGSFMSVGSGTMLLLAPYLNSLGGWRVSWAFSSVLSLIAVVTIVSVTQVNKHSFASLARQRDKLKFSKAINMSAIAVMLCFLFYSAIFVAVTAFLPSLLESHSGLSLGVATFFGSVVMFANGIGNLASGWLINRGHKHQQIIAGTFICTGVLAVILFWIDLSVIRITAAVLLTGVAGLIPGTLFTTVQRNAASAGVLGVMLGLMLQGAGMGQLSGPLMVTRIVEWTNSWFYAGVALCVVSVVGILCSFGIVVGNAKEHDIAALQR